MGNFFAELKRRHIYRVAAAYAVVAWVLLQVVNNVAPVLELPAWVSRASLLFLALGFPVAIFFAWMRELPDATAFAQHKATLADWAFVGVLVTIVGLVSYEQLTPTRATATANGVESARQAAASPVGAISLAVMPFENLSADKDQEFFSAGMTEEITSALSKIPDLRVVARASAFELKNESGDMKTIAEMLHATHLIKGSVRKAGTRLRITAQLINAENSVSIWTDNYDRELADVFAIQEDIARAIATSLRMPLGLKPGENLVSNRPKDQQTYELYLRGVNAMRLRTRQELDLLEQVVARDPGFAPGWAKLGEARWEMAIYYERRGETSKIVPVLDGAEEAGKKAIALAPGYAGGYSALGAVAWRRGRWAEAMDTFNKALALDPDEPELVNNYGQALRALGYLREGLAAKQRVALLEPLIPLYNRQRLELVAANGMTAEAVEESERICKPACANFQMPAFAELGRFNDVADMYAEYLRRPDIPTSGSFTRSDSEAVEKFMRALAAKSAPAGRLPEFNSEDHFVYAYTKTPERMLDWPEKALKEGDYRPLIHIWWPTPASVRKTERFKKLVRDAGLVDYWKARGWPDLCHPTTGEDFECN